MRKLRRLFALLLFLSIFSGVAHEMTHTHHLGDTCKICVIAHSPALPIETPALTYLDTPHEIFYQR